MTDEPLSGETLESFLEGITIKNEMNSVFAGLTQIGQLRQSGQFEGPITFAVLEQNAELFGSFQTQLMDRLRNYREYFYRGGNQHSPGELSYAEQEVQHLYQGQRPNYEEMNRAWDAAEEDEIYHIVFSAFDTKYYHQDSGIYLEFRDFYDENFEDPVRSALEGKQVVVKNITTVMVDSPRDPWYAITNVEFEISE